MATRKLHLRPAMHGHKREAPYGFCGLKVTGGTVDITDYASLVTCRRCLAKLRALGGSMSRSPLLDEG